MTIKPEQIEMIKIFDWLRHYKLDDIAFHIANERTVSFQHGVILKRMGVTKGVSDIFIARAINGFYGLFIEVKAGKGKPSREQLAFLETMNREGYLGVVRYGAEEVIKTIQEYLNLKSDA